MAVRSKKKSKIRIVPINEARYVKAVVLLPKEIVKQVVQYGIHNT